MAKSKTTFSSEYQPTKRRGKSKRNQMLNVLKKRGMSEDELWDEVLSMGMDGDTGCMSAFLNRLAPVNKAVLPKLDIQVDEKFFSLSRVGKLDFLTWASLKGLITPDSAAVVAGMITSSSAVVRDEVISMRINSVAELQSVDEDGNFPASKEYELLQQLADDSRRDSKLLAELAQGSDGSTPATDEQSDDELISVSLSDLVKTQNNNTDTETEEPTDNE